MIQTVADDPDGKASAYYRRFVLAVKPELLAEFTQAAVIKTRNNDYKSALEISAMLEGIFPEHPEVLTCRAFILEEQADALEKNGNAEEAEAVYNEACAAYQRALALSPPYADAFFNAGFFFIKRRNFDLAKECLHAYLDFADDGDPKHEHVQSVLEEIRHYGLDDAIFREAYEHIRLGEPEQGIAKIRDFIERHPSAWNGWFILGWGLRKLGRWEDGVSAFRKSMELGGGNCDIRNELAICLMESGDLVGARKELEISLREEPENVKILSNLGVLAIKTGNEKEAEGFFRIVLDLDPKDPVALNFFADASAASGSYA
jgi:tetratricopeptide (TPR) repeat protein